MNFLIALAIVYIACCAYLYFQQRSMQYFPGGPAPSHEQLGISEPQIVRVTASDNLQIEGWYWPPGEPENLVVVYFHGNAQEYNLRMQKLQTLRSHGYGTLFATYRGFGGNEGRPTQQGLYNDARAYMDWLGAKGISPQRIVLLGESLGTGVAVQMATEYEVRGVMLESAYNAITEVAKQRYFMFPIDLPMKDQYRSVDKIAQIDASLLFIHGTDDELIPIKLARDLYTKASEPKAFIAMEGAHHNDLMQHGVVTHLLSFLRGLENSDSIERQE